MSYLVCTCPDCGHVMHVDRDVKLVACGRCGMTYDPWDDTASELDTEPDYGGAFDGFTVHSDADTCL